MLNIENVTNAQIEEAKGLGYIVAANTYSDEGTAESEGFYWYDEIDSWVNVEKFEEYI